MPVIRYTNQAVQTFPSKSANEGFARAAAAAFAAYPDTLGKVQMKLRLYPEGELEVIVRDWGVGIPDVEKARAPLFTTGNEERSGMGFTIMESFMDTLRVRSKPGKGTAVTLRKKFAVRAGGRS